MSGGLTGAIASAPSLGALLEPLWRRRRQFLAAALVTFVAGYLLIEQLPKRYTATASILVDPRERRVTEFNAVVSALPGTSETVQSQIELLRSDRVLQQVVNELGLLSDPEWNPAGDAPPRGFPARTLIWFGASEDWADTITGTPALDELDAEQRVALVQAAVVARLREALDITSAGRSLVIEVSARSRDRARAQSIANAVAETFIAQQLAAKHDLTRQATQWLEDRLVSLRADVTAAERAYQQARLRREVDQQLDPELVTQQINQLISLSGQAEVNRAQAQARLDQVEALVEGSDAESLYALLSPSDMFAANYQVTELLNMAAQLSAQFGADNPAVLQLEARIDQLEQRQVEGVIDGYRRDVAATGAVVEALATALEAARSRALDLKRQNAASDLVLSELQREAEASRSIYETLLLRLKETQQGGFETADVVLASHASLPSEPSSPKRLMLLAILLMVAGGAGFAVVGLGEALENGFRTAQEVEAVLQVPSLGLIPDERNARFRDDPSGYLLANPVTPIAEALRALAFVLRTRKGEDRRTFMFTSSLPGEGKTSMVIGLGTVMAMAGRRVCIVDADLRRSTVGRRLSLKDGPSLRDVLERDRPVTEVVIQRDPRIPLSVVTAGPPVSGAFDAALGEKFPKIISELRSQFDIVLIDTPPVLAVADTRIIAQACDASIFVVQWRKTARRIAMDAVRELNVSDSTIDGVVVTRVRSGTNSYYNRYGDYGSRPEHE